MIIEHFRPDRVKEMYQRFEEKGRMLPESLEYINSWINEDVTICFQVMESKTPELIQQWIDHWKDLVDFEVIPVISSDAAKQKIFSENN